MPDDLKNPAHDVPGSIDSRTGFAEGLASLRTGAGIPLRSLASAVDVPASTLSGWMTGKHLPNLRQLDLLRLVLAKMGVESAAQEQWVEALQRVRRSPGPRRADEALPYRGLEAFEIDDAEWFFGRSELVKEVLAKISAAEAPASAGVCVVVGASGAGKSSLLRAGVASALEQGKQGAARPVCVVTPGRNPFESLAVGVAGMASTTSEDMLAILKEDPAKLMLPIRPVVIVDQFEELFTLTADADVQSSFLSALLRLAYGPNGAAVLLSVRADFYDRLAQRRELTAVLQEHQIVVMSMDKDAVRAVITEPARRAGVIVEPELVELLQRDFSPAASPSHPTAPGALPLLSHALLETWKRARRGEMTVADYLAAGGLAGAVEQTAESVFGQLPEDQQEEAKNLFLRMVNIDEQGTITRRAAALEDLLPDGPKEAAAESLLFHFVSARLLTIDESSVGLSHEVLLGAWPRLRRWVDEDREGMLLMRHVHDASKLWESTGRDEHALLAGSRLEQVGTWATTERADGRLSTREREFLTSSQERSTRSLAAAKRRRRSLIGLTVVSALLAVTATSAAAVATKARGIASRERNDALSRQIALRAGQLSTTDPSLAAQLALIGYRTAQTSDARSALLDARARSTPARVVGGKGSTALAIAADQHSLAFSNAKDGTVQLMAVGSDGQPKRTVVAKLPGKATEFFAAALSPDGKLLAAGGTNNAVALWELGAAEPRLLVAALGSFDGAVQTLTFSPDSTELAVGATGTSVVRWDVRQPGAPVPLNPIPVKADTTTKALTYSHDGHFIAEGGSDGAVHVWDISPGTPAETGTFTPAVADQLNALAFNRTGTILAGAFRSSVVRVFSMDVAGSLAETPGPAQIFTTWVNAVAFSPDGNELTAGSSDATLRTWRTEGWSLSRTLTVPTPITGIGYLNGGTALATVSTDGTARVWPTNQSPVVGPKASVFSVTFNRDGSRLGVFPGRRDGNVELWDTTTLPVVTPVNLRIPAPKGASLDGSGSISPDSSTMIAGTSKGPSVVWDIRDPAKPVALDKRLEGPTDLIEGVVYSPNGKLVAIGSDDASVHLWDMSNPADPKPIANVLKATNQILGMAFDPASKLLAAASADKNVYLWDISNPEVTTLLATLGGFDSYAQNVAFSEDSKLLAAGAADSTVRVWDIHSPSKPVMLGKPLAGPQNYVAALAFQPGSHLLAAVSLDSTAWIWDLTKPEQPKTYATLQAAKGQLNTVSFSPDGRYLVSSGADLNVYIWDLNLEAVAKWACTLTGDLMTATEWAQFLRDQPFHPACP